MKTIQKLALCSLLAFNALGASAMAPIADDALRSVDGQDGVSIAANLNINIGSFVYTDTDANGGSVSLNNIGVHGLLAATIDVVNQTTFNAVLTGAGVSGVTGFYDGGDVVAIAFPNVTLASTAVLPTVTVGSIKMGGSSASFGSVALNQIDLRGTAVYIWAH
jgi:hypothetical protein